MTHSPESEGMEGLRILVVDDQPEVLGMTLRVLRRRKAEAEGLSDPHKVLGALADQPRDLLMLDLTMPQLSGREVYDQVRAEHPELPVLFYSGYPQSAVPDIEDTTHTGYLQKPFTLDALANAVLTTVGRR